jgi:hypothetical protein
MLQYTGLHIIIPNLIYYLYQKKSKNKQKSCFIPSYKVAYL